MHVKRPTKCACFSCLKTKAKEGDGLNRERGIDRERGLNRIFTVNIQHTFCFIDRNERESLCFNLELSFYTHFICYLYVLLVLFNIQT